MITENKEQLNYVLSKLSSLSFVGGIILFGSQINGKSRKDSDIDIAILTRNIDKNQEAKIMGFSSERVDILIFDKLPLVIKFRVIKEGKILFLKDEKLYHEIKYETIRKYLDFAGFINNFYRRVIKNV